MLSPHSYPKHSTLPKIMSSEIPIPYEEQTDESCPDDGVYSMEIDTPTIGKDERVMEAANTLMLLQDSISTAKVHAHTQRSISCV